MRSGLWDLHLRDLEAAKVWENLDAKSRCEMLLKGTCIRNFNGPGVFKVICVVCLGCFWGKTFLANYILYTIHKSNGKPFFLLDLGLPGNFTSHLVTIQIPKTVRFEFAADIAGLKRKMLLCRKETPQKVRSFINRIGSDSAIFMFIARSVLWRAIAVDAGCLSRNYLKLPEGLLGSFGFKGLSCPKTGEFDYNPLPSVPSMLCRSENGRVHHWLVPIWRQKEVADHMWSIQILVCSHTPEANGFWHSNVVLKELRFDRWWTSFFAKLLDIWEISLCNI